MVNARLGLFDNFPWSSVKGWILLTQICFASENEEALSDSFASNYCSVKRAHFDCFSSSCSFVVRLSFVC